jgi:hypothetical protein
MRITVSHHLFNLHRVLLVVQANMTWMLDNDRSFVASEELTNVPARLQC